MVKYSDLMEDKLIYLDNASTSRQYDEVIERIYEINKNAYGNPSSLHSYGLKSERLLSDARKQMIEVSGYQDAIFTASGTEADNIAIFSSKNKRKNCNKYITSKIEHPAVLESMKKLEQKGNTVVYLDVDNNGMIDLKQLENELDENTNLVSIMTVNNEIGTIEPINQIREMIKKHAPNALLHTDGVQAFGKIRVDNIDADMMSISGHKFHGPNGIGSLLFNKNVNLKSFIQGGGQEKGIRSGTEDVSSAVGLSLAAKMSYENFEEKSKKIRYLNEYLYRGLESEIKDINVNGPKEIGNDVLDFGKRCSSILNVSFIGTRGEVLLHTVEQDEIYISTGSACSSNKKGQSHVLGSIKLNNKEIEGAIRFSFSEFNTTNEMDIVIDKMAKAVNKFRKLGSYR